MSLRRDADIAFSLTRFEPAYDTLNGQYYAEFSRVWNSMTVGTQLPDVVEIRARWKFDENDDAATGDVVFETIIDRATNWLDIELIHPQLAPIAYLLALRSCAWYYQWRANLLK